MAFDELDTVIEIQDKFVPFEIYRLDIDISICGSIAILCNSENKNDCYGKTV